MTAAPGRPLQGIDLDHVAIALHDRADAWPLLAGHLGGEWLGGGIASGFAAAQVRFANGMKVEALEPANIEQDDFLARFLARSGPGPHHLTFKVPDLAAALDDLRAAGHDPVGIDLASAGWKELFLHPKASHGVVVQVAQSADDGGWGGGPRPAHLPPASIDPPAPLAHVAHAVADLDAALLLFKGVLGGVTVDAGAGGGLGWVELAWPGPGRVRLLAGPPVAGWLDGRPGRVHHLAFVHPDPSAVPGAMERTGHWEIEPSGTIGTRVVIVTPDVAKDGFPAAV